MAKEKATKENPTSPKASRGKEEKKPVETVSLLKPRVTEKANTLLGQNVYAFEIPTNFSKKQVATLVKKEHGVTPLKVNMIAARRKKLFFKGKRGSVKGVKKAYVFLKSGDKIA